MWNGNSVYGNGSGNDAHNDYGAAVKDLPGRVVPCWKFGISPAAMFQGALGF